MTYFDSTKTGRKGRVRLLKTVKWIGGSMVKHHHVVNLSEIPIDQDQGSGRFTIRRLTTTSGRGDRRAETGL